jgi:hypothetical protein
MEGIAIVTIVFLSFTLIIGTWLLTRHRERTQIIEKGLNAEEIRALAHSGGFRSDPLNSLKWGMVFVSVGLAALIGVWLESTYHNDGMYIPGLIAVFGGAALVLFYVMASRKEKGGQK